MHIAQLAPNHNRAKTVRVFFYIMLGINCLIILSLLMKYVYHDTSPDSGSPKSLLILGFHAVCLLLDLFCELLTAVFFIMWFRRSYANLHKIDNSRLSNTEGWAAGGWFVPFLNLVYPYQIMKEIWNELQRHIYQEQILKGDALIGLWWAAFLISRIAGGIVGKLAETSEEGLKYDTALVLYLISTAIEIPAILITLKMIRETSSMETELFNSCQDNIFREGAAKTTESAIPAI